MANKKHTTVDYEVGIVGAGFGGIGAAIRLKESGQNSIVLFEKGSEVGGTWRDNIYPGCACDIPSHVYSFSFELNPNWSRAYSKQPEILKYILHCKEKYQLEQHIRYNTKVTTIKFEEKEKCWRLTTAEGKVTTVRNVILALGPLSVPKIPVIKGVETFKGKIFHSAEWDTSVDLTGKRVAIIGTGASAIQIVPEIVGKVAQLDLYQRSAPWVLPRKDGNVSALTKKAFQTLPFIQQFQRSRIYWYFETTGVALFSDNLVRKYSKKLALDHLKKAVKDPVLREKLTPKYEIGCKRRVLSDDYYPALVHQHVDVVTNGIDQITADGIIDKDGKLRPVDVIVWATGFHVGDFLRRGMDIIGLHGQNLFESWAKEMPQAYYGTCISGYPGLMMILGPNTGLGHNSQLHVMESQYNYILDYLKQQEQQGSNTYLDVKSSAQARYNTSIHQALQRTVWAQGGCNSWYLDEAGRNPTLWPSYTVSYRKQTQQIIMDDFRRL